MVYNIVRSEAHAKESTGRVKICWHTISCIHILSDSFKTRRLFRKLHEVLQCFDICKRNNWPGGNRLHRHISSLYPSRSQHCKCFRCQRVEKKKVWKVIDSHLTRLIFCDSIISFSWARTSRTFIEDFWNGYHPHCQVKWSTYTFLIALMWMKWSAVHWAEYLNRQECKG